MAQTQTLQVRIDAAINAEATLKTLRELKQLQKETVAGSADYKKIQARINDIGDAAKTAKGQSEDWIDALAGAGGPIGALGRGLDTITSSTNKFGLALKATGIGLIVALVGQLVAAFTSNEKAMKKLEPIMIAFEQILGGIFEALEPVFDLFIDLAMKAMPYVQKAIGGLYAGFSAFFTLIKTVAVGAGKILKGIFTLDFDSIKDGVKDLSNTFVNTAEAFKETYGKFETGMARTTKTQKKNLQEGTDAHKKWLDEQKAILAQDEKDRQANLDKQKALAMAAAKTDEERLAIEKKYAEDSYNSKKKLLEDQAKLYPKGSKEYQEFQSQLIALDADYINKKTEFRNKDKELAQKAFQDEVKAAQDANKRKVDDLTSTYNKQKELYGENSKQARDAQDAIFKAQQEGLEAERKLYQSKKELTKEEKARLEDIINAEKNLTNNIIIENERRRKADLDAKLKKAEQAKADSDKEFERIFLANQLNLEEQGRLLEEKKKKTNKLFHDAIDEAAADLEERLNKAYGVKDEVEEEGPLVEDGAPELLQYADLPKEVQEAADRYQAEMEGRDIDKSLPTLADLGYEIHEDMDSEAGEGEVYFRKIEPSKAPKDQSPELDEDMKAEIEGLKADISANTKKQSKLETIGGKEFYTVGDVEYEVKRSKTGELEFEGSESGKAITRKSPNYDKAVAGYILEKYADAPATETDAQSEEGYYSAIASTSNNPLEILIAASAADESEGGNQRASGKDLLISQHHISFNAADTRRAFGYDISDMGSWEALRSNFYDPNGTGIDQSVTDINLVEGGEAITEQDLWDYMEKYPNGFKESDAMGPITKSIGDRFTAITGAPFDRQTLEVFREANAAAARIPESDQDALFDWWAANPQGTIEQAKAEVELTDETKTVLDETENSNWWPWDEEASSAETDKGSTDVAPVFHSRQRSSAY